MIMLLLLQRDGFMGCRMRRMVVSTPHRVVFLMNGHRSSMMRTLKVVRLSQMKRQIEQLSDINKHSQHAKQVVLLRNFWRS